MTALLYHYFSPPSELTEEKPARKSPLKIKTVLTTSKLKAFKSSIIASAPSKRPISLNKKKLLKIVEQIKERIRTIEEESSKQIENDRIDDGAFYRHVYPDQADRIGEILERNRTKTPELFETNFEMAKLALSHFADDPENLKTYYEIIKRHHKKHYRNECTKVTYLRYLFSEHYDEELKSAVDECINWVKQPRKRLFIYEYISTIIEQKGLTEGINTYLQYKKFVSPDHHNMYERLLSL
ncbi:MAG: hypothetical protein KAG61_09610 [Bacteriovoracaceae bacterium]|nr:hypothetical protein [Bacteriovoracaceae bacterium]